MLTKEKCDQRFDFFWDLNQTKYGYDGLDRRIFKSVQDHENPTKNYTRKFIFDGSNILAVLDGNNNFVASYIHGEGIDDPLVLVADLHGTGEMSVLSLLKDRQQSVKLILGESGEILQEVSYSAYGETQIYNRAHFKNKIPNTCYYTSRELEEETGEYYYRARYYDPYTQKFLSQDPKEFGSGDLNYYRYVFNNPLRYQDPQGEIAIVDDITLALAYALLATLYAQRDQISEACTEILAALNAMIDDVNNSIQTYLEQKQAEKEQHCMAIYESDWAICKKLSTPNNRTVCYNSAHVRLGECSNYGNPRTPLAVSF